MNPQNAHLIALADALTTGRSHQFEQIVKAAYGAGVSREDLLTAVEMGRLLVEVPIPVLSRAYAAVHAWHWMVARRACPSRRWSLRPPTCPLGHPTVFFGPFS